MARLAQHLNPAQTAISLLACGQFDIFERIADGIDPNARDPERNSTIFFEACRQSGTPLPLIRKLIAMGAYADSKNRHENSRPVHAACEAGRPDILRELASNGADLSAQDSDGNSCLHYCSGGNSAKAAECAEFLLKAGLDPNAMASTAIMPTPLLLSCNDPSAELAQTLLQYGADPNLAEPGTLRSPLHFAAQSLSLPLCKILLAAGADPCLRDKQGLTASALASKFRNAGRPLADFLAGAERSGAERRLLHEHTPATAAACAKPRI